LQSRTPLSSAFTEHLKNIFETKELDEKAVCRDFRHTAEDGKDYTTRFYNLDAIIAVGFRVNSARAIQFRQWATGVLRDYAIRGYMLDRERLKNGAFFNKAYFEDLLAEERGFHERFRLGLRGRRNACVVVRLSTNSAWPAHDFLRKRVQLR
jgi:hypothetical protein